MYKMLSKHIPPSPGPYLVRGIAYDDKEWYRVLDWDYRNGITKKVVSGFSAGGLTINAYAEITHWADIPPLKTTFQATKWPDGSNIHVF